MPRPIMLIDAYNLFARNYIVNPTMSKHGHYVGGSLGFIRSIGVLAEKFQPSKIIVCWEGGGAQRRRDIYPEYKAGRKPIRLNRSKVYEDIPDTRENFNHQIKLSTKLLSHLPVQQMYVPDCEADDIIGYVSRHRLEGQQAIIISMDQDFHQLLGPNVKQYSPSLKKILDENYVLEKFGVTAENFVTARSFIGDGSDNITGIKGCGFKTLCKRFPELGQPGFVSVEDIISQCQQRMESSNLKMYRNIINQSEIPKRNWKLMYLDTCNLSSEHIKKLNYNYDNFEVKRDKIGLIRSLIAEGVDLPQGINPDTLFFRINSCVVR